MKQLLILSGKGGTGKTTIASAFIKLSNAYAYDDCDVDAPNLHIIMEQKSEPIRTEYGMPKAEIENEKCIECGICKDNCRFEAILHEEKYEVNNYNCEGCGVCEAICPADAIKMKQSIAGELRIYCDDVRVFSTAQLKMGSGTSGKLVTEVKKQMFKAIKKDTQIAIIDGSPGIGCPVIASLSGVDMVLIVAEPSLSGISDMKRIIKTAESFHVTVCVCINKYDTNLENTIKIEEYCKENGLAYTGAIPFDKEAVCAINNGKTIVDVDCISGTAVRNVYRNVINVLFKESTGD